MSVADLLAEYGSPLWLANLDVVRDRQRQGMPVKRTVPYSRRGIQKAHHAAGIKRAENQSANVGLNGVHPRWDQIDILQAPEVALELDPVPEQDVPGLAGITMETARGTIWRKMRASAMAEITRVGNRRATSASSIVARINGSSAARASGGSVT